MCDQRKGDKPKVRQGVLHAGVVTREIGYQGNVLEPEGYLELFIHNFSLSHRGKEEYGDVYGKKRDDPANALTILTRPIKVKNSRKNATFRGRKKGL